MVSFLESIKNALTAAPSTQLAIICVIVLVAIGVIALAIRIAIAAYNSAMREKFHNTYGILVNKNVRVRKRKPDSARDNYYSLSFPTWEFPNKNGSRDKRRANNCIVWGTCLLYIDTFVLSTPRPEIIGWLVRTLRRKGAQISASTMEETQTATARREETRLCNLSTARSIYESLEDYEFEEFCARVLKAHGYHAKTTKRTGDGGWDIEFIGPSNVRGIAECKRYNPSHKVGRPELNKLKGANSVKKADRLLFFTTSSFAKPACEFARSSGIELIDGQRLAVMARPLIAEAHTKARSSCAYEWPQYQDFLPFFPPDFPPSSEFFK